MNFGSVEAGTNSILRRRSVDVNVILDLFETTSAVLKIGFLWRQFTFDCQGAWAGWHL